MQRTIDYYRYKFPISLSTFLKLNQKKQLEMNFLIREMKKTSRVNILAYCLMPNHFHLILEQHVDNAIQLYMSDIQNSYTRYYNIKYKRLSALLNNQFKAKRIKTDDQLLHVSRYIHLNPYTSYIIKDKNELSLYPWSSLHEYLDDSNEHICKTTIIQSLLSEPYIDFVLNNAEYQRELKRNKE
jgi:putative transposase